MKLGQRALPAVAIGLAVITAILVHRQSIANGWLVTRVEVVGVFALALGIALRSERLVASATAPVAIGLLAGAGAGSEVAWGSSLVVGFLWFLAFEAAIASIEWRAGWVIGPAVLHRRLLEVATVVALGSSVGLMGLFVATWAPERSILVRVALLTVVMTAMVAGSRHLAATTPVVPSDE